MSVISVAIEESSVQLFAGIPKYVTVTTNIPSTIFYTLDGSDPNLFSNIYTSPIILPDGLLTIILKVFATDGTNYSPILTEVYQTDSLDNTRKPHAATTAQPGISLQSPYPFASNAPQPNGEYLNPGDAGVTVNDPSLPQISSGYDADGYPNAFTNEDYNVENYQIVFNNRNAQGNYGKNIGNIVPVTVKPEVPPPEETKQFTNLFNPKALVIFQDYSKEDPTDPPTINKQSFSLENPDRARDGSYRYNNAYEMPANSGNFIRSEYNPRDNTITYYYFDSWSNRWIISKNPYTPTSDYDGNLSAIPLSKTKGSRFVFEWRVFPRRVLF